MILKIAIIFWQCGEWPSKPLPLDPASLPPGGSPVSPTQPLGCRAQVATLPYLPPSHFCNQLNQLILYCSGKGLGTTCCIRHARGLLFQKVKAMGVNS